ncbi:MAG: hypothetical protein PVJ49_19015 [Acidobacteriota bacterium]|jgi:hypothetical protein
MDSLNVAKMYARFVTSMPGYLRRRLTVEDAREAIRRGLAERETNFLRIARRCIYDNPRSAYLPLLRHAGCELGDLESSVRDKGLEPTLDELRAAGVYFTFEEYKGRAPVRRGSLELEIDSRQFDNPLTARAFEGQTTGSTGAGTRVETDVDNLFSQVPHLMMVRVVNGIYGAPTAVWYGAPPDPTGLGIYLRTTPYRNTPRRWFTPWMPGMPKPALKYRMALWYVLAVSRLCGVPCARPEPTSFEDAVVVARWAADAVREHGMAQVICTVSLAVRVSVAAVEAGIDLSGVAFFGGGEPFTAAKKAAVERSGARYISFYISEDVGPIALTCAHPIEEGDNHLVEDGLAVIQHPREVPGTDIVVEPFHFTSLRPHSSKVLLNVQSDDYGIIEERSCGCGFEELGYHRHVRRIRSFGKLTGEGVTLVGSEMIKVLEEVLPQRFEATPLDFQLLEEEDENGLSRLSLLVHPRVQVADEQDVIDTVFGALEESSTAAGLAGGMWQQAKALRVRRQEPIWTATGKLIPIRVAGLHGPAPADGRVVAAPTGQATP